MRCNKQTLLEQVENACAALRKLSEEVAGS